MSNIQKNGSRLNSGQVLQKSYNDVDATLSTSGFLTGKIGNKITREVSETNVAGDTETYTFFDGTNQLYQLKVIYTDGDREDMLSAERIS